MKRILRKSIKNILFTSLIMTMVFSTPISHLQGVFAEDSEVTLITDDTDLTSVTTENIIEEPFTEAVDVGVGLLEEDEAKREQNVKHFYREDGLMEAVFYPYSVHFDNSGVWTDIDNSLVEKNVNGKIVYENTSNSFKVNFSKETDTDSLVSLDNDGSMLSWVIPEMDATNPVIEEVPESTDDIRFQNKLFSKITYEDAINGVDVTYMLTPSGLKEYFIIENEEELKAFNDITMVMKADGLDVSNVDNKLQMKKDGASKFILSKPVMFDSSNEFVSDVSFEVKEINAEESVNEEISLAETEIAADKTASYINNIKESDNINDDVNYYIYTIDIDKESIADADITYPLIIDPDITVDDSVSNMHDTFVSQNYPTTNYGGIERLKIGYGSESHINRVYMKMISLPELNNGDMIVGAKLYMIRYFDENTEGFAYDNQINLHKVTSEWNQSTMTWNNKASYDSTIISCDFADYIDADSESDAFINEFDITKLVKEWYEDPTTNYGVMLKNADETSGYHEYRSADQWNEEVLHQIVDIVYVNSTGIESTYSYHELSVGRAGTVYINDATGNATVIHEDAATTDGKMPVDLYHVFDNNYREENYGYGLGWRINYDQSVEAVTIEEDSYYKYTDGDGTVHYYYKDGNVYYDEGNKQNKLTVSGNTVVIEFGASHIKYTFTNSKLSSIADSNGNTLTINRNSAGYIECIKDPEGSEVYFTYSGNLLESIIAPTGQTTKYYYDGNLLDLIEYADGKTANYSYYEGCIDSITDIEGYKVDLDYNSTEKLQVSKATEYAGNTAYNYLNFDYKTLLTTVTDSRGRINHYRFNKYGQLINEQDYEGSTVYYDYETSTPGKKDNLNAASDILSTAINLVENSSFEYNEGYITSAWQIENTNGTATNNSEIQLSPESYVGDYSLELFKNGVGGTSKAYTNVTIEPGKTYTVSLYYKGIMEAYIFAEYTDASGNTVTEEKELIKKTGDWTKNTLVVSIPSGAGTGLKIGIVEKGATTIGFGAIDAVQVSENGTSKRYNLIKNSDFASGLGWWASSGFESGDGFVQTTVGNEYKPDNLNDIAVRIKGNINTDKYIYQSIGESGVANDSYMVGAFVKSDGIPEFTHTNRNSTTAITYGKVLVRVEFINNETVVNQVDKEFSYDTSDWQYLSFNAKATGTFTSIRVSLHFIRNQNTAYFDGVSLYKDGYGTNYSYDSNNNLEKIVTKEGKTYLYEYDSNNNLIKSTDEYGDVTEYDYDAKHNLTLVTTIPEGTEIKKYTKYDYNSKGNLTQTKTYDSRDSNKYFISTSDYINNYKNSDTDARGNSVNYSYDTDKRLGSVEDYKDTINYLYDSMDRVGTVYSDKTNQQVFYSYSGDNLSAVLLTVKTEGIRLRYSFSYNTFGQLTNSYVNNQLLSTNTYNNYKQLETTTYANGYYRKYHYNSKDQLTEIIEPEDSYEYVTSTYDYSDEGYLTEVHDKTLQRKTLYDYDDEGRLIRALSEPVLATGGTYASVIYSYDEKDRIVSSKKKIGDYTWTENYTYDDTEYLNYSLTTSDGTSSSTKYDYLGRVDERISGNNAVVMDYGYEAGIVSNSTTGLVNYFFATGQSIKSYSYDETGLITSITAADGDIYYNYDSKSQLTAVIDERNDTGTTYTYDDGGNITNKVKISDLSTAAERDVITYTYDTTWPDLLVSYDGQSIVYDEIGNPTRYLDYEDLNWVGKNLACVEDYGNFTAYYGYDYNGLRKSKQIGNVKTEYIYTDNQLSALKTGNDMLYFSYDSSGTLVSVRYNDNIYYYVFNPQGDVVGLCTEEGAAVCTYTYDEWGKPLTGPTSGIGALNPFRYRGYIYDSETGFYYLHSRYYDPEVGRFINADSTGVLTATPLSLTDKNLFAYCDNNPIMRSDYNGAFWDTIYDIISLGSSLYDVVTNPDDSTAWIGLAGDTLDLIPGITGLGEAAKAAKVTNKIANGVDTATDVAKTIDKIDDTADIAYDVAKNTNVGWKLGDDITNLTKAGNRPSWSTLRQRYWKNEALYNPLEYSDNNLKRMRKGLAPKGIDDFSMELHHPYGRKGNNYYIFEPVTKTNHIMIHYGR